jgi:hypothetical protein
MKYTHLFSLSGELEDLGEDEDAPFGAVIGVV